MGKTASLAAALLLLVGSAAAQESAWTLFEQGLKEFNKNRFDQAERIFEAAVRMDTRCEDAYFYLGRLKERKGAVRDAVACYQKVTDKYPTYPLCAERLGQLALKAGEKEAAVKYFQIHAEARPTVAAYMQLANVQLELKLYKEAEEALKKASEISSGNLDLADMFGRLYMETERFGEALDTYSKILEKIPIDNSARFLRGLCLQRLERGDEAIAEWEAVLTRDPYHAMALKALVTAYTGDVTMADKVKEYQLRLKRVAQSKAPARPVKGGQ